MSLRESFIRGSAVLGLTQVAGQVCSLGRNIIIARLISPKDFGIAAVFLMIVSLLEMISNLSLDRLLVQAADGNDPTFQQVGHLLQALRGTVNFILLLALAGPVSTLFSIPEARGAFYVLASIPLLNGFRNLDPQRMERSMRFWPGASIEVTAQFLMLAFAWPLGNWFGDYRAMLYLLILKSLSIMIGSHVVAERRYAWSKNKKYIQRFFSFGWPLLINGLLMFGILQGDRFILGASKKLFGSIYNMADVGVYSAAFMLTMMPAMMSIRIGSTLFLPVLSVEQNSNSSFNNKSRIFSQILSIIAATYSVIMLLMGDKILPLLYGSKYSAAGTLVGWLSIMWALRIIRVMPSVISMAKGNTKILMHTNIIRILSLFGVIIAVIKNMELVWLAIAGILGELLAYSGILFLNKRHLKISAMIPFRANSFLAICIIFAISLNELLLKIIVVDMRFTIIATVALSPPFIALFFFPEIQKKLRQLS